jgi:hypothetical protein
MNLSEVMTIVKSCSVQLLLAEFWG